MSTIDQPDRIRPPRGRGQRPLRPAGRRHRQGHGRPRPHRRGGALLPEAVLALGEAALELRVVRLHPGRGRVGFRRSDRRGTRVHAVEPVVVLPRRGARDDRAAAVRDRGAVDGRARLPVHADLRRGAAHGLLRPLLQGGLRRRRGDAGRQPRPAAAEHEPAVGRAVRRHPARLRRGAPQGPDGHGRARARRDRLHDRDRGDARADRRALHPALPEGGRPAARASARASPRSTATSRATSASASSSWPTRSRTTRATSRRSQDTLQETLPIGTLALAPPMVDDPYSFRRRSATSPTRSSSTR